MDDGDISLDILTVSADGVAGTLATGFASVNMPTVGAASVDNVADGIAAVETFTLAGLLGPVTVIDGASFLPELELSGSLEPAMALCAGLEAQATGLAGTVAEAAAELPAWTAAGGIDAGARLPAFMLQANGVASALIAGALVLPVLAATGSMEPALALPAVDIDGAMLGGALAQGEVQLVTPTLEAVALDMAGQTLPAMLLNGAGLAAGTTGNGSSALARLQVGAAGHEGTGSYGELTFALLGIDGAATATSLIEGFVTIAPMSLVALAGSGTTAAATLSVPLLRVDADGHASTVGQAAVSLPALLLAGVATAPLVQKTTTIALNTQVSALTEYGGLVANSFAHFGGVTLAATASGIVALAGDTDLGAPIAASVLSGVSDYGKDQLKRIIAGYVGYRADGDMELTLITDEHEEYVYHLAPRAASGDLHVSRVKFGRGAAASYWQWKLANRNGADFALDALDLDYTTLSRRLR
jgi:hypothetical protein